MISVSYTHLDETLYHLEAIYHPRYCWFPSRRDLLVKGKEKYSLGGYSLIQYDGDSPVLPEGLALLLTTSGSTGSCLLYTSRCV